VNSHNSNKNHLSEIPVVILCGGRGTRLYPDTKTIPKPLVKLAGIPIVVHIINYYISFGVENFYLALGYKSEEFEKYFSKNTNLFPEKIKINLIDTGLDSMTGGRLLRLKSNIEKYDEFMLTYGDGLSDVDLNDLYSLYQKSNCIGVVTAVHPPARFGLLKIEEELVKSFQEKPQTDDGWINGGFFIFKKSFFSYLNDDSTILEKEPLENLSKNNQLAGYKHYKFWQCMDTPRDRKILEEYLVSNKNLNKE
tara:strand:+ start:14937 stop:15689 length:753 start_codon:yes stop_codon:yes gene_type:complete